MAKGETTITILVDKMYSLLGALTKVWCPKDNLIYLDDFGKGPPWQHRPKASTFIV